MANRISQILDTWTAGLSNREATVRVFQKVRDIPYGTIGSRDPLRVFQMNRGTCSGKHFLLAYLFRLMGIDVEDMVALHKFTELPRRIEYPDELKELVKTGNGIPDYHNFIKVYLNDRWVTLDATFDGGLRDYFVVNDWDGSTDTELSIKARELWEVKYPLKFKLQRLKELSPQIQEQREGFLKKFSEWLEILRRCT